MQGRSQIDARRYVTPRGHWSRGDLDRFLPAEPTEKRDKIRVGLLVPFSGIDAMWGPSSQYSAVLASALINASGGILGREIELFGVDSGGQPDDVVRRVGELLTTHDVDVLVGTHMSNVRVAVREAFSSTVPYIYATQYEGGERARGMFAIGETPERQYREAIRWMVRHMGAKRWYLLGNDYVWPHQTHAVLHELIHDAGGDVVGIDYVSIGGSRHAETLRKIRQASPDIVFESLVGSDCVTFNKAFAAAEMQDSIARISGVIEENVLMGIGAENTRNLYAVAGYFNSLSTLENRSFLKEYEMAFGDTAPIQGGMSQTCYESIFCLATLAKKAGSLSIDALSAVGRDFTYFGARGRVTIGENGTEMACYLMKSDGIVYDLIRSF
jgi:ABC-type branched-subunit amino acid transport system substrate-binding protein